MAATNVGGGSWAPFKEILHVIEAAVVHKQSDIYAELDEVLTRYKLAFLNLLKNQARSNSQLEELKKSSKDGLNITSGVIRLSDKIIQNVALFSESLNLNEFASVELFLAAEQQLPNFPGFSQQNIASLLYHDGRRSILSSLKLLLTARPGLTWTLDLDDRINELIEKFSAQLIQDEIAENILHLLQDLSLPNELIKLENAKALADGKHKKLITELIEEQQLLLADCLFALASQYPLSKNDCSKVMNYLKLIAPNTSDGSLDAVTVRVLLSLLTSFNCDTIDAMVGDLEDDQYESLPYFKEKNYFSELHQIIIRPDIQLWQTPSLKYIIHFCWGVFLRSCAAHPGLSNSEADVLEEDEGTIDVAIENDVLKYITKSIIEYENFYEEEYFVKLMHSFVTSFIVKFPLKMKDMRNRGDENARIIQAHVMEGMEAPHGLRYDFQDLLTLVSKLYKKDPLNLELNNDYWLPLEPLGGGFMPQPLKKMQHAVDQRKVMLNKFIRLAGDILLQPLYVPYINMLTSLSNNETAASFCFRLLASNGSGVDGLSAVTWDHFFASIKQYYISLRQVPDSSDHRTHLQRHQEISPEELQGLEATLTLIQTVALHNENVRIAFCENQNWLPVASLLGLVSCAIPPNLKGLLMETLAAFAATPEIAASLWQSLEASQVLQTNTTSNPTQKKSGIAVELVEIEARNEAFPETLGFLKLIDILTDASIPSVLGAGYRVPGFGPYLKFLYEDVFLKFRTRAYQNPDEKWKVGISVLKIFVKILTDYDINADDFMNQEVDIQGVKFGRADKPSGFQLLLLLCSDSPLFRTTLAIINDVADLLSSMLSTNKSKGSLEEIVELCLTLISVALDKQALFNEIAKNRCPSMLLSPLDDLLLSINPHSSNPDYLYILARFMTINNMSSSLILNVVKIFKYICKYGQSQQQVVSIVCQNETSAREILVGFAEKLELTDPEQELDGDFNEERNSEELIRENLVELLITSVEHPSPNLAQFLLGFDIRKPVSKTTLQGPGIGGYPKTCLHSVLDVLNRNIASKAKNLTPKFTEQLYHLIYLLCSNEEMGQSLRRYLRTNTDFIRMHCQALPFLPAGEEISEIQMTRLANQQAWFLKTVAIELKVLAGKSMRSSLEHLISILFNHTTEDYQDNKQLSNTSKSFLEKSQHETLSKTLHSMAFSSSENRNILMSLLASLSFEQRYPPNIDFQYFDYNAVEQLIGSCEEVNNNGLTLCNVNKLFKLFMNEINISTIATGAGQRQEIIKETHVLLKHAVERNLVRESFHAKHNVVDAWRQVIEVLFATSTPDILPIELKQTCIVETLQFLVNTINNKENLCELTSPVSGIILSLMANLSFTFKKSSNEKSSSNASNISMNTISTLLPGIIECIINSSSAPSRMRANLYAAFLYYIQMVKIHGAKETQVDSMFRHESKETWKKTTYEVVNHYGEAFMEIVAKDMCQAPCITRMMSLSVSDTITCFDWKDRYLMYLTSHGYLRVLVDQLMDDDMELQNILSPQPTSMKPLYLFQSKMSFLSKMASTEYGVQTLLQNGVISRLAECQFLDLRINKSRLQENATFDFSSSVDPFMPNIIERYSKLFKAFAKFILSILSVTGLRHQAVISQVQALILSHDELFLSILQDQVSNSLNTLQQLSLTIAIISLLPISDSKNEAWEILTDDQRHWRTFMNRVQRLMPILLRKYTSQSSKKYIEEVVYEEGRSANMFVLSPMNVQAVEIRHTFLKIRSRILTFFKNSVASNQDLLIPRVIFSPSFNDNYSHEVTRMVSSKRATTKQLPSLVVLLEELKEAPDQLKLCLENKISVERKLNALSDMSQEEIREILHQEGDTERLPFYQRTQIVHRILTKLLELRTAEANSISYNMEHALYLLWRHLDYYYHHCIPTEDSYLEGSNIMKSTGRVRRLTDTTERSHLAEQSFNMTDTRKTILDSGVTKEEINNFKQDVPTYLNEQFWKKIKDLDTVHNESRTRLSFTSALTRRMQSAIKLSSVI